MEKNWPPLESCPQFVYRWITPFVVRRYPWEDEKNIQDWYDLFGVGSTSKEVMDSDLEATKKFLHEMRATRGYGFETGSRFFNRPFCELKRSPGNNFDDSIIDKTKDIILAHISERTRRPYELVDVVKFLWSTGWLLLVTIEAKESMPDSVTETFLAAVSYGDEQVLECFLKPDDDAPTECIPTGYDFQCHKSIPSPDNYFRSEEMNPGSELLIPF